MVPPSDYLATILAGRIITLKGWIPPAWILVHTPYNPGSPYNPGCQDYNVRRLDPIWKDVYLKSAPHCVLHSMFMMYVCQIAVIMPLPHTNANMNPNPNRT